MAVPDLLLFYLMSKANPEILTLAQIKAWPKAELHSHLDGAMRLATMLDLAEEQNKMDLLPAKTSEGLHLELAKVDDSSDLYEYLAWFKYTIGLMQSESALERVAFEMAEDFAMEQVKYVEVRFGPILHTGEGLNLNQVMDSVIRGLNKAKKKYDIEWGIIVCALRDRFVEASLEQAQLAVSYMERGVVAFDLAGAEAGNPAKQHLEAFYYARNHMLNLTVHAGESWGPESIRQALFFCGAHRIGHGITLVHDDALLAFVRDHQIPLEICPTSNIQTNVVSSYEEHPIKELLEKNVPVTVNTDSRLFSHTNSSGELYLAHTKCGLTADQTRMVALNGFRYAFLPLKARENMLKNAEKIIWGS